MMPSTEEGAIKMTNSEHIVLKRTIITLTNPEPARLSVCGSIRECRVGGRRVAALWGEIRGQPELPGLGAAGRGDGREPRGSGGGAGPGSEAAPRPLSPGPALPLPAGQWSPSTGRTGETGLCQPCPPRGGQRGGEAGAPPGGIHRSTPRRRTAAPAPGRPQRSARLLGRGTLCPPDPLVLK